MRKFLALLALSLTAVCAEAASIRIRAADQLAAQTAHVAAKVALVARHAASAANRGEYLRRGKVTAPLRRKQPIDVRLGLREIVRSDISRQPSAAFNRLPNSGNRLIQ